MPTLNVSAPWSRAAAAAWYQTDLESVQPVNRDGVLYKFGYERAVHSDYMDTPEPAVIRQMADGAIALIQASSKGTVGDIDWEDTTGFSYNKLVWVVSQIGQDMGSCRLSSDWKNELALAFRDPEYQPRDTRLFMEHYDFIGAFGTRDELLAQAMKNAEKARMEIVNTMQDQLEAAGVPTAVIITTLRTFNQQWKLQFQPGDASTWTRWLLHSPTLALDVEYVSLTPDEVYTDMEGPFALEVYGLVDWLRSAGIVPPDTRVQLWNEARLEDSVLWMGDNGATEFMVVRAKHAVEVL